MSQHYSDPRRESDPHALPDLEVFYHRNGSGTCGRTVPGMEDGWYWWPCFPGCLPNGEPSGPFASEEEALADAREGMEPQGCPAHGNDPCDVCYPPAPHPATGVR